MFLHCALSNVNTLMFSLFWGTSALGWSNWTAIISCLLAASVDLCCFVMKIKLKAFWLLALKMTFHMTELKFMNLVCVCLLDEVEECLEWAGWKTWCPGGKTGQTHSKTKEYSEIDHNYSLFMCAYCVHVMWENLIYMWGDGFQMCHTNTFSRHGACSQSVTLCTALHWTEDYRLDLDFWPLG